MKGSRQIIGCLTLIILVTACGPKTTDQLYVKLEEKELASGVRYDSLFRGLYFGMRYDSFRIYCMRKHLQGEFHEGGLKSGSWLECKLQNEMKHPASLNFYPEFRREVISEMRAALYYDANVSFKEHPFVKDSLLNDALKLMERWYGKGFLKIESPDSLRDDVYVKVNGNRRITVYTDESNYMINLWFVDLKRRKEKDEN